MLVEKDVILNEFKKNKALHFLNTYILRVKRKIGNIEKIITIIDSIVN